MARRDDGSAAYVFKVRARKHNYLFANHLHTPQCRSQYRMHPTAACSRLDTKSESSIAYTLLLSTETLAELIDEGAYDKDKSQVQAED